MKTLFRSCESLRGRSVPLILLALWSVGPATAGQDLLPLPKASYTAQTKVIYSGDELEMRTLHRGSWERQEITVDDLTQVTILRPDRNRAYVMFLQSRQLSEMPYAEAALLPSLLVLRQFDVRKLSDTEVAGEAVSHFQVSREFGEGEAVEGTTQEDATVVLDVWVTADGIVMQAEGEILVDGFREPLQLSRQDVRRQDLDPALFEPSIPGEP